MDIEYIQTEKLNMVQQNFETSQYKTLFGLVQRYSPSGKEDAAVEWMIARMKEMGFDQAYRDNIGNAIGIKGSGKKEIVLLGHIDTVPGEIPVHLVNHTPLLNNPILYGRGSVDAKGPLASFIDAVAAIDPGKNYRFVVIGAIDEERNSIGARHIVDLFHPMYAIIGEPSSWNRITLGYKGSAHAKVTIHQPMQHSAGEGSSASEKAIAIWNRIQYWTDEYNQKQERIFNKVLPALKSINAGNDDFATWASLEIGVRLPPGLPPKAWYAKLQELAGDAELQQQGFAVPAYRSGKQNPLVSAFLRSIRSTDGKPGFSIKTGTADMNIVAPTWNCPIVAYGPGDSSLDHTPNEHIALEEYSHAVQVLKNVLAGLIDLT